MGRIISRCDSPEKHRRLSQKLLEFAHQARQIVSKHQGHTVYSGGDDVVALVPLSQALPLSQELAKTFRKTLEEFNGTASAGIVVAHHLYPLSEVVREAKDAEHTAKRMVDPATGKEKNAVCVRVLRRSGETLQACSSWEILTPHFDRVVEHFAQNNLASRLVYEMSRSAYALAGLPEAFQSEMRRLITRHKTESSDIDAKALAEEWAEWLGHLPGGADELCHWLMIARFVAQGGGE